MTEQASPPAPRKRILLDLKPAFDGYAGIPQETRLLFSALRRLDGVDAQGLLQHGVKRMRGALRKAHLDEPVSSQINRLSKLVASVSDSPPARSWAWVADRLRNWTAQESLRIRCALGMQVTRSTFDSRLFPDFVWRTLFEKTLNIDDKAHVAYDDYCVLRPSRLHFQNAGQRTGSLTGKPRFPVVDTRGFDYFVAQTPFPGRVTPGTRLVVRYHDAVPILLPHTIKDKSFHQAAHFKSLLSNVQSGATFACISEATRKDLVTIFPEVENRALVIHNMISEAYFPEDSPRSVVPLLVRNRLVEASLLGATAALDPALPEDFEYLLMVGTIEPRKNHLLLMRAWERLKYSVRPQLKLVLVGNVGWDEKALLRAFRPWAVKGELLLLQDVPAAELRALYKHALVTVCPSLAEGFDYSGVEAMRCGCPVASSDIPVHREVYGAASAYFNAYSVEATAECLARLITDSGRPEREQLSRLGHDIASKYLARRILPAWEALFDAEPTTDALRFERPAVI
jgi:glycosyltransferase involved in cell wall biosynthesis